jgi:hypothetical protein
MGSGISHVHNSGLHLSIIDEVNYLISNYKIWVDKGVCDNLRNVYSDKLMQFNTDALMTTYVTIENKEPVGMSKKDVCDRITRHYAKRIAVLRKISNNMMNWQEQVRRINSGKMCRGLSKAVTRFKECRELGGTWMDEVATRDFIKTLRSIGKYDMWVRHHRQMVNSWKNGLIKLKRIVKRIKNMDKNLSTHAIEDFDLDVDIISQKLDRIMDLNILIISNFS